MQMTQFKIPNDLIQSLISNTCILFAGSGLSAGVHRSNGEPLPTWDGLLQELLEFTQIPETYARDITQLIQTKRYRVAADIIKSHTVESKYYHALQSIFFDPDLKPNQNHQLITSLPFRAMLTTNYDTLLEDSFSQEHYPVVYTQQDLASCDYLLRHDNQDFFLIKMHGDIKKPSTIILGDQDYRELIYQNQAYRQFIQNLLLQYTLFFVGFGLSDDDIRVFFEYLKTIFPANHNMSTSDTSTKYHYALLTKNQVSQAEQSWYKDNWCLIILEYDYDTTHSYLTSSLEELNRQVIDARQLMIGSTMITDIKLLSELLWTSTQAYYQKLMGPSGRFAQLNISELILPEIKQNLLDTSVRVNAQPDSQIPLLDSLAALWQQPCPHTVIVGTGGMGKTVSLIRLWREFLEHRTVSTPIPIYLALNEYNNLNESERHNYLLKMIGRAYLDKWNLTPEDENALRTFIKTPLQAEPYIPKLILLLDGFNEVTADHTELLLSINEFLQYANGVQLMITSRYDLRAIFNWNSFNSLELLELVDSQIIKYLEQFSVPPPQERLLELIRNPMMLTLLAVTSQVIKQYQLNLNYKFKIPVNTVGELLWNFSESQIIKTAENSTNPVSRLEIAFLLRHLLPYLGYQMEKQGKFYFQRFELEEYINQVYLKYTNPEFLKVFPMFVDYETELGLATFELNDIRKRFIKIKGQLCYELGMLVEENQQYRFLHQYFRDYFAAINILNEIQIGLSQKQIPAVLQKVLSFEVRRLLGELEGEYRNIPLPTKTGWSIAHYSPTQLEKALNLCRGHFETEFEYPVWNIIEIWKDIRKELTGSDLTNLNLYRVVLNGICNVRWDKEQSLIIKFDHSLIHERNLLPQGHSDRVLSVEYSNDGKKIVSSSADKTIKVWDTETGECLGTYKGHSGPILSAVFSIDGQKILSASWDKTIKEWDIETGRCIYTYEGHSSGVKNAIYSIEGQKILSVSADKTIKEWSVLTKNCLHTYKGHVESVESAVYSFDGQKILSASSDHSIKEWSVLTQQCLQTFEGHSSIVLSAIYSEDGKKVLSASVDKTIKEWDAETGQCLNTYLNHSGGVVSAIYSNDGQKILSASSDKTIKEWSIKTQKCFKTYYGHTEGVISAVYSSNNQKIASASIDNTIKEWSTETGECLRTYQRNWIGLKGAIYSNDNQKILTVSLDRTIKEWSIETGKCIRVYQGHNGRVESAIYSYDGRKILSTSTDKTIKEWSTETGECLTTYKGHSGPVTSAVYSYDDQKILSSSSDKTIKEWSTKTGECLYTYFGHIHKVLNAIYSKDNQKILSSSADKTIKEWSIETTECIHTYQGHTYGVESALYSRDGQKILSASWDRTIKEWSTKTGQCIFTYHGHIDRVLTAIYSIDEQKILSASVDGTIREWDISTENNYIYSEFSSTGLESATYSPDGKKILSASMDGNAKEWSTITGECLCTYENIPGLLLQDCTFKNINSRSKISNDTEEILKKYGVKF
jgi:WD40 repeat protein